MRACQYANALPQLGLCPLPIQGLPEVERVLIFVPHPDDECLGCGGAILKWRARGVRVRLVLVTDGSGAGELPEGTASIRQQEFRRACEQLGVEEWACWDEPDGQFVASNGFVQRARTCLQTFAPELVLLPSPLDYHRDHVRITAALAEEISSHASILHAGFYEVWSPLPVSHVIDITDVFEQKRRALMCHETALSCGAYDSAMEGLNRYRALYLGGAGRYAEGVLLCSREAFLRQSLRLLSLRLAVMRWH